MEPKFTVLMAGGGNLCHGTIATIGHNNPQYTINVLSTRPEVWGSTITAYTAKSAWESKGNLVGRINRVSKNPQDVAPNADIVYICSPAHHKPAILRQIRPYLKEGAMVGSVFGQGAFDVQAFEALGEDIEKKKLTIFSLQYVPFICKVVNYGKDINIIGPKRYLYAASYPTENIHYVCNALSHMYFVPCVPVPNFLTLTLTPGNQIIHPGRVVGFFDKFPEKANKVLQLKDVPLLYEGLDDASANEI